MQYTTLGNTGLVVSRLAFGAMTFTAGDRSIGAVYKTDAEAAAALVGRALDAGINFFDTADGYASGQSERILGETLRTRRDEVVIATKVGFRTGTPLTQAGLSRRHVLWSVDQSLKRLGTDWIDAYIVHKEDPYTPLEETLSVLDEVVRSGRCAISASRTGQPGRSRRRSKSRKPPVSRASRTVRCTILFSAGTSNAT